MPSDASRATAPAPTEPSSAAGPPLCAALVVGETHRRDLRVGECHPRDDAVVGDVDGVPTQDDLTADAPLVLAHVRQQGQPVAVAHGVEPAAVDPFDPKAVVDLEVLALELTEANGVQTDVGRPGTPPHRDQDLVRLDLPAVFERAGD